MKPEWEGADAIDEREAIIKSISNQIAGLTLRAFLKIWLKYIGENSRRGGRDRRSVADFRLRPGRNKDTLIIVNPGASMKLYEERLHELSEVATICTVPTALPWSFRQGLEPDFCVVADSSVSQRLLLNEVAHEAKVLAATTVHPDIGDENDTYWWTPILDVDTTLEPKEMDVGEAVDQTTAMQLMDLCMMGFDLDLDWRAQSLGCVSNMAVLIAQNLRARGISNAKRIVLLGADYAGWGGYERCPMWGDEWPLLKNMEEWIPWDDTLTSPQMITYKLTLLRLWMGTLAPIYTMSHGILREFPRVEFDDVMNENYPDYITKKEINERCEAYFTHYAYDFPLEEREHAERVEKAIIAKEARHYTEGAGEEMTKRGRKEGEL